MKICFICNYRAYSGALEVFRTIAKYAKEAGHETAYVYHAERKGDVSPDMTMFDELIAHPYEGVDREVFSQQLADIANRFDVVHTSLLPQDWRFLFKAACTRPMVETYHSLDGWKWCWRQFKWRATAGKESPARVTIAVSEGLCEEIAKDMQSVPQTAKTDIRTIRNGVDIPKEIGPGGPYVTYCGRIADSKGLDIWLKIAEELHREIPEAKFQWVGEISPQYDDFAYRCLQAAAPWLECVGFQTDLAPYYRRSKVLLLTSPSEGLPMCILEAGAYGVPSVAFDTGDVSETPAIIATDEKDAIETIKGMFSPCIGLPIHPNDLKGIETRMNIINKFSAQTMARDYLDIYWELLK